MCKFLPHASDRVSLFLYLQWEEVAWLSSNIIGGPHYWGLSSAFHRVKIQISNWFARCCFLFLPADLLLSDADGRRSALATLFCPFSPEYSGNWRRPSWERALAHYNDFDAVQPDQQENILKAEGLQLYLSGLNSQHQTNRSSHITIRFEFHRITFKGKTG